MKPMSAFKKPTWATIYQHREPNSRDTENNQQPEYQIPPIFSNECYFVNRSCKAIITSSKKAKATVKK